MDKSITGGYNWFDETLHPAVHDHFCCLYDTEAEWKSFTGIFIKTGLTQGEKCLFIFDTHSSRQVHEALRAEGVEVADYEASGQLSIVHGNRIFNPEGEFNPQDMTAFLEKEVAKAQKEGYPVLRITGETGWILNFGLSLPKVLEYEAALDRGFVPSRPCMLVCQYRRSSFSSDFINSLLFNHRCLIFNNRVNTNLYYLLAAESDWFGNKGLDSQALLSMIERDQLRECKQRNLTHTLEVLLDEAQSAILGVEEDGRIMYANHMTEGIFECGAGELIGRLLSEFSTDGPAIKRECDVNPFGVIRNGEVKICVSGCEKILKINVIPVTTEGRRLFYATGQDITSYRKTEQTLLSIEEHYRRMLDIIQQGMALHEVEYDRSGRVRDLIITAVNPAFTRITGQAGAGEAGLRASEVYGTPVFQKLKCIAAASGCGPQEFTASFNSEGTDRNCRVTVFDIAAGKLALIFS